MNREKNYLSSVELDNKWKLILIRNGMIIYDLTVSKIKMKCMTDAAVNEVDALVNKIQKFTRILWLLVHVVS